MTLAVLTVIGCNGGQEQPAADAQPDAAATPIDGNEIVTTRGTGSVVGVIDLTSCPMGAPPGSTCKQITVRDCPDIESESVDATLAILPASGTNQGTITHFKGGGGEGFLTLGTDEYQQAGFAQVFVSWNTDWEQTQTHGIKTAGCRPATVLRWIFDELHGGSRTTAFCAEGKSGGSAQLGYSLAQYGLGDILDYVTLRAGPPFARIDLGCDGSAPPDAVVCGDTVKMTLPPTELNAWENIPAPLTCGGTDIPATELERWKNDSVAVGGVYDYPKTRVEFFDCTNNAPAVTGMSQILYEQVAQAENHDPERVNYHCYSQAGMCSGEGLGPAGETEAINTMLASCRPRHM